jgi:hypothetical protein
MCSQFDNRILYNKGFCRSDGTSLMALGVQYTTVGLAARMQLVGKWLYTV